MSRVAWWWSRRATDPIVFWGIALCWFAEAISLVGLAGIAYIIFWWRR